MQVAHGKAILNGVAIGPLRVYQKSSQELVRCSVRMPEEELNRFEQALEEAKAQLEHLYAEALEKVGEDNAAIFEIHRMMLEDDDYLDGIRDMLREQGVTAEYAVERTGTEFAAAFANMDDSYMKARAVDVKDVSRRVVDLLLGRSEGIELGDRPVILVADDLTPSETVQLDKSKLLGFVTRRGSANSHTAILARTMNIPALIGVDFDPAWDGCLGVIDGGGHCLYVDPEPDLLANMERILRKQQRHAAMLSALKGTPNRTKDGREINVYTNIGRVEDVDLVLRNDAGGIGLFRSEFIYLDSQTYPTEEEQYAVYKRVVEAMDGKKVIFRTLDIGADKQADYFELDREDNPALGFRAIRICLTRRELFRQQLTAMLRASAYGPVSIMFPMIISVWEVQEAKKVLEECREALRRRNEPFGEVEIGVMVETPAAVMIADELAREVSFFSLGTNDLTQYTLAIDRQNPKLDAFYDAHHPAVLRMIQHTVEAGHRHNCWVGICGELGAELSLTETFLRMGIDELSVSPGRVLPLREKIQSLDLKASRWD